MTCSNPPPVSDEDINLALDGVAPEEVVVHLAMCGDCMARLNEAQRFEQGVRAPLYRWDCPTPETLGVYHLGFLTGSQERAITNHLTVCVRCADEVEVLRTFLVGDTAPQPRTAPATVAERAWQPRTPLGALVARIMPSRPGFGAVRGAGHAPLVAQSPMATIILDRVQEGAKETMLVGQIADDEDDQDRWTGALVAAYLQGAFVGAAVVDDLGSFTCGPLPSGNLQIHITSETGPSIQVEDVTI